MQCSKKVSYSAVIMHLWMKEFYHVFLITYGLTSYFILCRRLAFLSSAFPLSTSFSVQFLLITWPEESSSLWWIVFINVRYTPAASVLPNYVRPICPQQPPENCTSADFNLRRFLKCWVYTVYNKYECTVEPEGVYTNTRVVRAALDAQHARSSRCSDYILQRVILHWELT